MRFHFSHVLPRLHSADKFFSFALNYPKYFPKAPGIASKSFYRQKNEAQRAGEGKKKKKGGGAKGQKCETCTAEDEGGAIAIVFGDFWYEEMSEFLTLWTGSAVSSSNSPACAGWSGT